MKKQKSRKYKRYIKKQIKKTLQEKISECNLLEKVTSDLKVALGKL